MAGLLAAENRTFAVERLEDVAVADIRRNHAHALFFHQAMEAEVRHRRHRDLVDTEVQRKDGDDLIAVDGLTARVDGKHAVAVAVERNPDVELPCNDAVLQRGEIRCSAADVDVVAVRLVADRLDVRTEL